MKKLCSAVCLVAQSCPTICSPMDCSPPGFSVHGILQARILEWAAAGSRHIAYWVHIAYCILSAALSIASSFRIWNSSTRILSLPGAIVRSSTHDKGHEEGASAYAKAGLSLRSPPGNSQASTPHNQSLPTFCFVFSPTPLTLRGLSPTTSLWKKS